MRQIVLDTETTGLDPALGHRIIEIGCVELINRRLTGNNYHQYLQPDREIDEAAIEVHGITNESLLDKPRFPEIAADFIEYIKGAELIIHNAPFDTGFINNEFGLMAQADAAGAAQTIEALCSITDTLKMARTMHPGQRNSLDALCKRYEIDNSQRTLHGALLDSEILADVYLAMTGGQTGLFEDRLGVSKMGSDNTRIRRLPKDRKPLPVLKADDEELKAHRAWIEKLNESAGGQCLWAQLELD
ncbi:MAG: DNA polymerase III subunit epsilon [Gammaproteobacteria bacterium]|nr:DNA polymerase III subunit epsilon [Gammaproteobacteria bacterium]